MNIIKDTIEYITKAVKLWVIISPWEKAIRVRFGKHQKELGAGIHFKIPFFDGIYKQTIRLRILSLPMQTLSSFDAKTVTIKVAVGYSITDIKKLYNTLHEPETTVNNIVLSEVSTYISNCNSTEYDAGKLSADVLSKLQASEYGLNFEYVKVLEYAIVKTIRLLQDKHWHHESLKMDEKI